MAYSVDKGSHQELVVRSIESLMELTRVRIPGFGFVQWVDENQLFGIILDDGRLLPRIVDVLEYLFDLNRGQGLWNTQRSLISNL